MIIRKVFYYKICRNEKFSIQNLTFWKFSFQIFIVHENVCFRIWFFFSSKISFQTLIFNEKVCVKNTPFKMGTKSGKFVVFCGANWVKTLFLRCDVFIKVWFLNENWIQNLNFRKKFSLHKTFIGKKFFEIRNDEKLSIQKLINL